LPGSGALFGGPRRASVARTLSRNVAREAQPSKVFVANVPSCASDTELCEFLGHPGAPVFRIKEHSAAAAHQRGSQNPPFGWWSGKEAIGGGQGHAGEARPFSGRAVVALPSSAAAAAAVVARHGCVLTTARGGSAAVSVTVSVRRVWEGVSQQPLQAAERAAKQLSAARPEGCCTVWVGGLPKELDDTAARAVFSACGELAAVRRRLKTLLTSLCLCSFFLLLSIHFMELICCKNLFY
jgi:hypothetical protein